MRHDFNPSDHETTKHIRKINITSHLQQKSHTLFSKFTTAAKYERGDTTIERDRSARGKLVKVTEILRNKYP